MLQTFAHWLVDTVGAVGYPGIILLMAVESSFIPFPSEVVMIPAGYLAKQGQMHLGLVIFCGAFGSMLGALANYMIAATLGRRLLLKYSHWFLMSPEKFQRAERFLLEHGEIGTFVGRIIPVVRQYISFPAGLAEMPLLRFSLWTGLGAGFWVTVLALIGFAVGGNEQLVRQWSQTATLWAVGGCIVLLWLYVQWKRWCQRRVPPARG
ncbi:MAG: DedA family protein [Candidatus Peribacteraceae bacterium]|nr:DedA family protein [Candidatus Peribacteraceae bacterium]MDD5742525.1 DedA family protein [Candidatus Peribacteraceae bacterium]